MSLGGKNWGHWSEKGEKGGKKEEGDFKKKDRFMPSALEV